MSSSRRRFSLLQVGVAATLALSVGGLGGCEDQGYCFDCGGAGGAAGQGGEAGTGGVAGQGGVAGTGGVLLGGFGGQDCSADVLTDLKNCGFCGNVCDALPNAFVACEGGFCVVGDCAPGFLDLDATVANGCEYACAPSAGGFEVCDGVDNDCNGSTDELTDKTTDVLNCGACGVACAYSGAEPACVGGSCAMGDCFVGFHDVNGSPADGCEYACTESNGSVEACDYADNDCDGATDEGFDLTSDPVNCGACSAGCALLFPGSVPTCDQSVCVFGPCLPDFYDYDGVAANGCEYACSLTNGGAEACDGLDNDCNGLLDDGVLPGVGDPCGASDVGECQLGALVCSAGALACVGEVGPSFELCDGLDNDCSSGADEGCPVVTATDTRLDLGASSGVGQATSTQLSVGSSGNLVVASYLDRRTGNADIRANVSTDGGVTWLSASDLVVATGANVQVEPWSFASSAAYVAFAQFPVAAHRDVYLARAEAPFSAFGAGVRVDKNITNDDAFFVRGVVAKPGAADHVVVVWQGLSGSGANVATSVWLQRSLDGGATWLAADLKLNAAGTQGEFPAVCSAGDGRAFVAYRDTISAAVLGRVYDTNTGTLGPILPLSDGKPAEDLVVACDTSNAYVAWTDLRTAKKQIRLNRSADFATFQPDGAVVNLDSTFADANAPTIAAGGGAVVVAWEDTRSGQPDVRVNRSLNGGATFSATSARADLGTVAGTSASLRPTVAYGAGGRVFVAWEDARSGQRDIFANHSFDGGLTFQPIDLRLDVGTAGAPSPPGGADSRSPVLVTAGARGVVTWVDYRTAAGVTGAFADIYTNRFE